MTPQDWAVKLHAAIPIISVNVWRAWVTQENVGGNYGTSSNNPLGIMGGSGVAHYASPDAGVQAVVSTLSTAPYHNVAVTAANGGSDVAVIQQIGLSPWDAGHYMEGCTTPGCALLNVYHSIFGSNSGTGSNPGLLGVAGGGGLTDLGGNSLGAGAQNVIHAPSAVANAAGSFITNKVVGEFSTLGKMALPYVVIVGGILITGVLFLYEVKGTAIKAAAP